jgi:hypothetical protein
MWSSGHSSWLQIQRSRVRFPAITDFLISSGSGTGPLSLVSITEELLEWKSSGSGSRKPETIGRGDPLRRPRDTLYPQKLAVTSPTSGGGLRATEFSFRFFNSEL